MKKLFLAWLFTLSQVSFAAYNPNNPNGQATMANSAPVVIASDQSDLMTRIEDSSGASITLGQKTSAQSLPVVLSSDIMTTPVAKGTDAALTVKSTPSNIFRTTFANVIASGVDTNFNTVIATGSGQTVSQSAGNLVITTGTTTNAETIIRSNQSFSRANIFKAQTILSQRIVNQTFFVELVDVIGDGLTLTVNSATSITVTIPSNPFTSANVGQSMYVGAISGVAGAIPGRYAIASVSGNNVNFTVAGWPGSGSGTVSLFGWNYHQLSYSGTTATNAFYDAQRRGWNSGTTTATINTTTSPGHMAIMTLEDGVTALLDQLVASVATLQTTVRASRVVNVPEETTPLFVQLRAVNGSTAPVSTTTWTVGTYSIENYAAQPVTIASQKAQAFNSGMPVQVLNTPTTTIAAGTAAIGDVGVQYRANATGAAARTHLVSAATTNATIVKASAGRLLGWYFVNTNAATRYIKLHNQATSPTAGTGVVQTIAIPPNGIAQFNMEGGIAFATGIALTAVTGSADSDTTAVGAGDIVGDIFYQ